MPETISSEFLYNTLSGRLVSSLMDRALSIGLFVVAFGYVRHATVDPKWLRTPDFAKHVVLLAAVVLFASYVAIAYGVEYAKTLDAGGPVVIARHAGEVQTAPAGSRVLKLQDIDPGRRQLLLLIPVDMIGIVIVAGLFAILLAFSVDTSPGSTSPESLIREVVFLFALTACWHVDMIAWWLVYSFSSSEYGLSSAWKDIAYHATYAAIELGAAWGLARAAKEAIGRVAVRRLSLVAVVAYSGALTSIYVVRLWDYAGRYILWVSGR